MNKEGWEIKKLAEVCDKITDGSHNPPKGIEHSDFIMLSSKNIIDGKITFDSPRYLTASEYEIENRRTNISPNDLLLTIVGTIGRTAIVPDNIGQVTLQRSVAVLKPKQPLIISPFLKYTLDSKMSYLQDESRGVAQKGLYLGQLKELLIPIPPLPIQNQIVAELDELNNILDKKRKQLEELDTLAQATFYDMFGDPVENEKGWEMKRLGDIAEITSSKRIYASEYLDVGIPFFRSKEVIEKSKKKSISVELFISKERYSELKAKFGVPKIGDILITAVGTIGEMWVVDDTEFYFKDGNIIWFKSNGVNNSIFLLYSLKKLIYNYKLKMSSGSAYSALTIVNLKDMQALLPPLTLQNQFAERIEVIEKQKELINKSIVDVQLLFNYTMDKYFN